ncbi:MAG TPA: hypothetical protein VGM87_18255 [Roseomonas sp.]
MQPIATRRPLMLLAAGWILAALPAAAQAPGAAASPPAAGQRIRRGEFRGHIDAARTAIAGRHADVANQELEQAEAILQHLRAAQAGAGHPAGPGRAAAALKQARDALAAHDLAAADAALRPLAEQLQRRG